MSQQLPDFNATAEFVHTKTPNSTWKFGDGSSTDEWKQHKKIQIDPFAEGRSPVSNYSLIVGSVLPRPIALVSSEDSKGNKNLAPFSYFAPLNHDPPMFAVSFSTGRGKLKDTAANILETGECCINLIGEWFTEAANATCINAPAGVSEWDLAGLTPEPCVDIKPSQVAESAFSIECKLARSEEWFSKSDPEKQTGVTLILEGVRFHVRSDIVNEAGSSVDVSKLKPVSRLGGNFYGRTTETYEMTRPNYKTEVEDVPEVLSLIK